MLPIYNISRVAQKKDSYMIVYKQYSYQFYETCRKNGTHETCPSRHFPFAAAYINPSMGQKQKVCWKRIIATTRSQPAMTGTSRIYVCVHSPEPRMHIGSK